MKKKLFLNKLSSYILPALLGSVICFSVVYALYRPFCVLYSIIYFAAELFFFWIFDKIKNKKVIGGLIYIGISFVIDVASMAILFSAFDNADIEVDPITWFYGNEGSYSYIPEYLNSILLFGGFFILSILYYFTQIRYRSLGVMLAILFPFVIYAKRADIFPELAVTVIITLFLAVMVHNRRIDPAQPKEKQGTLVINPAYLVSIALFVSITGAVVMSIDKPTYMSKLEKNANYFDYVQTDATGAGNYEDTATTSSQRYGGSSYSNTPLFYFETDGTQDVYFLRRQAYDIFNGDVWEVSDDAEGYARIYSSDNPEYSTDDILNDMQTLLLGTSYDNTNLSQSLISRVNGRVYDDGFNPMYLPAPLATIADENSYSEIISSDGGSLLKLPHGEIYRRADSNDSIDESFEFLEQTDSFKEYVAALGLTREEYEELLNTEYDYSTQNGLDKLTAATKLINDYTDAVYDYTDTAEISDNLTELTEEITADCTSDYEKVLALESYFEESGYIYDLEYVPDDTSIDYFVFTSKTGSCTSYATAMTLMARAIGLPARYVEGFSAFEKTDSGAFVVRDSHAHAFVEVYIPGAGWMTFDPTVSDYQTVSDDDSGFSASTFFTILNRFLVVIIVVFVVIFVILLDRIIELLFRIGLKFKPPAQKTLALYAHVIKLVNFSAKGNYSSYTVKMLREYLTATRGAVPEKLFDLFEKTCFGGYVPTKEEFKDTYAEYKKCYKYLRKIPRKKKQSATA